MTSTGLLVPLRARLPSRFRSAAASITSDSSALRSPSSSARSQSPATTAAQQPPTYQLSTSPASASTSSSSAYYPPAATSPSSQTGPPAAADPADLPLSVKDAVFLHQVEHQPRTQLDARARAADPLLVTPGTLLAGGVCDSFRDAAAVHAALVRAGIVAPYLEEDEEASSGTGSGEEQQRQQRPTVVTARIGAGLARQTRVLSVAGLRALVRVLFFWEEEATRLRLLRGEEAGLREALAGWRARREVALARVKARAGTAAGERTGDAVGGGGGGSALTTAEEGDSEEIKTAEKMAQELEIRLRAVRMEMRLRPSRRLVEDDLPRYEEKLAPEEA